MAVTQRLILTLIKAALRLAGSNPKLAIKIGRALIITHDYSGAIKYYKKSLKRGENFELRLEMADLLKKLKRVDEAESILLEGTEHSTRKEFYSINYLKILFFTRPIVEEDFQIDALKSVSHWLISKKTVIGQEGI